MQLAELQQAFGKALLGGATDSLSHAIRHDAISAAGHLLVYRNNVEGNIVAALAETFAATFKMVGEGFFSSMARQFLRKHPPASGDLNLYGEQLADFIAQYAPAATLPYLADLARFEWAWNRCFFAPADTALNPASLTMLAEKDVGVLRLIPRASLQLVQARFPVDALWNWCEKQDGEGTPPVMDEQARYFLLWRPQRMVNIRTIDAGTYALWQHILRGAALHEAASCVQDIDIQSFLEEQFTLVTFSGYVTELL